MAVSICAPLGTFGGQKTLAFACGFLGPCASLALLGAGQRRSVVAFTASWSVSPSNICISTVPTKDFMTTVLRQR